MSNTSPFPTYRETVLERAHAFLEHSPEEVASGWTPAGRLAESREIMRSLVNELEAEPLAVELLETERPEVRVGAVYTFNTERGALFLTVKNIGSAGRLMVDVDGTDTELVHLADFVAMIETGILELTKTVGPGGFSEALRDE